MNFAQAIAHREQLRRLHNQEVAGTIRGADTEWRRRVFKPSQLAATRAIHVYEKSLPPADAEAIATVGDSRVKFPAHCRTWSARLEHLYRLRDSLQGPALTVVAKEYDDHKFAPDRPHLADQVKLITRDTPPLPDPVEDFQNDYTEADERNSLSLTGTNQINISSMCRAETAYFYRDMNPDYFWSEFEHLHEFYTSSGSQDYAICCNWAVANNVEDFYQWNSNNRETCLTYAYTGDSGADMSQVLRDTSNPIQTDSWASAAENTWYWGTIERDAGDVQEEIRTTSHSGTLQDTISIALNTAATTYRYIFGVAGSDSAREFGRYSGTVRNLDLQWVAPPSGNSRVSKRFGGVPFAALNKGIW